MKKGIKIALISSGFIVGALYGASFSTPPLTQEVAATSALDEQIKQYEQAIAEGREFVPTYSEQINRNEAGNYRSNQTVLNNQTPAQVPQTGQNMTQEIGHNAVSQFGQSVGNFLMWFVREVLRAIVRFFNQLMTV